jgi:transposase
MSLQPQASYAIPEETKRVAQAAFPKGNIYMQMYEELGVLYTDAMFAPLFPARGQPAESPARLALVLIMQFAENLTDRQAADAVRSRIDWKYALGLELTDPGFDFSVLSEFRDRLLAGDASHLLFEAMLTRFREKGLFKGRGKQRTDSTHVLAAIRSLNWLEMVGRTLQHALNMLAQHAPDWVRAHIPAEWFARYRQQIEEYRLPRLQSERQKRAEAIGNDGWQLLDHLEQDEELAAVRELPAFLTLREVWGQQYVLLETHVRWRPNDQLPPSMLRLAAACPSSTSLTPTMDRPKCS